MDDNEALHAALARLHEQLQQAPPLDAQSRQLLRDVGADIARLGGTPAGDPPVAVGEHAPRLESLAVNFESGHPALAATLREFIALLTRVGI